MGRSVERIGDNVVYFDCSWMDESFEWDDVQDNLQCCLMEHYPSLCKYDKWVKYPYRENQIILENDHVSISISEYCGCGAVSVFVNQTTEYPELADYWLFQVWSKLRKIIGDCTGNVLIKRGTFSNGVSVYDREGA